MKIVVVSVLGIICFFSACKKVGEEAMKSDIELFQLINDSTSVFEDVVDLNINMKFKKDSLDIKIVSVTAKEFESALNINDKDIRYFTSNHKVNEGVDNENIKRIGSLLCLGKKPNNLFLYDLERNNYHRARNFFFHSRIGNYYIIQRTQFEDKETLVYNIKNNEVELFIPTINVSTSPKDSLMFISDSRMISLEDKFPIDIVKLSDKGIDTLFSENTRWFAPFSFFDSNSNSIYYIHSIYKNNKIVSDYAKMDISPLLGLK